jgi:predicted nicotinamide N-methyase
LPALRLHLATEVTPLWQATERQLAVDGLEPPFWAFAWAGGQALARFVLDAPAVVRERCVLDFASGSGLVAIAAARAGAAEVVAVDRDPLARAAIALNAELNGVKIDARCIDVRQPLAPPAWVEAAEVVLAGDVCYDREMAPAVVAWLHARAMAGALVLLGDPGRAYLPGEGLEEVARYWVPTPDGVEASAEMEGVVYRIR